jgi:hypothetical protein
MKKIAKHSFLYYAKHDFIYLFFFLDVLRLLSLGFVDFAVLLILADGYALNIWQVYLALSFSFAE